MKKRILVLSCEHAVDTIPKKYQPYFASHAQLLKTHRGIDFGAQSIARHLQNVFNCELYEARVSRLLIDCNRSLKHATCFSEISLRCSEQEKQEIINSYYLPYRQEITQRIREHINQGLQVWHVSVHSFTPILHDQVRKADIGLLYDPSRSSEKKLASLWCSKIKASTAYRVRKNYPYKGIDDGFTRFLRMQFSDSDYVGLELESNQALVTQTASLTDLKNSLANSLLNIGNTLL